MNWDWSQLVDVRIADGQVVASVGPVVWILVLAALATWLIWHRPWQLLYRGWRVFEIRPTFSWHHVAHRAKPRDGEARARRLRGTHNEKGSNRIRRGQRRAHGNL